MVEVVKTAMQRSNLLLTHVVLALRTCWFFVEGFFLARAKVTGNPLREAPSKVFFLSFWNLINSGRKFQFPLLPLTMSNVLVIKLDLQIHITFLLQIPKWNGFSHTTLGTKRALHDLPVTSVPSSNILTGHYRCLGKRKFEDYR